MKIKPTIYLNKCLKNLLNVNFGKNIEDFKSIIPQFWDQMKSNQIF